MWKGLGGKSKNRGINTTFCCFWGDNATMICSVELPKLQINNKKCLEFSVAAEWAVIGRILIAG